MKKRLTALLCTAALCVSLLMPSAFAAIGTGCEHKAGGRRVQAVEQA